MNSSDLNNTQTVPANSAIAGIPAIVRLCLLIVFDTVSIAATLINFTIIVIEKKVRSSFKTHPLIVILTLFFGIQTISIPLYINFLINSTVLLSNPILCQFWQFVDFFSCNGGLWIMAWTAIDRHILVYHNQWITTRKRRILQHDMPLLLLVVYIFTFYVYAFMLFPCTNTYDYNSFLCGSFPCYLGNFALGTFDALGNAVIPSFIEAVFSLSFLIRFIWHKYQSNNGVQWRKQRQITIQLLFISCPNFAFIVPWSILFTIQLFGVWVAGGADALQSFYFLSYFTALTFPIIFLASTKDMRQSFKKIVNHIHVKLQRHRHAVESIE